MGLLLYERLFYVLRVKNCIILDDWLYLLCRYKVEVNLRIVLFSLERDVRL